jgi:predicted dehydrogenase
MLEKPIVENWQQAIELVKLLDKKGKKACVGQTLRGDYMIRMMDYFLREGIIGKIETLQFENHWYWTENPEKEWRFKLPHIFLDDIAIHQIDEIRMLLGNAKAKQIMASCHTPSFYPIKSLLTTASGIWTMEDGTHVNYFGSMGLKGKVEGWYGRLNIFGDKGSMFRESSGQPFVYLDGKKEPIGLDDEYGEDIDELIPLFEFEKIPYILEDFYHAIHDHRTPITDLHDNLNTFAIMLAMKRSSEEHRAIILDEEFPRET